MMEIVRTEDGIETWTASKHGMCPEVHYTATPPVLPQPAKLDHRVDSTNEILNKLLQEVFNLTNIMSDLRDDFNDAIKNLQKQRQQDQWIEGKTSRKFTR